MIELEKFPVHVKSVTAKMKYMSQAKYVQNIPTDCMKVLKNKSHCFQKMVHSLMLTKNYTLPSKIFLKKENLTLIMMILGCCL